MSETAPAPKAASRRPLRLLPQPMLSFVLFLSWNLAQNDISPGSLIMGAVLGWAIPLFTARFWPDYPHVRSYVKLFRLMFLVLWDIVMASLLVARQVLGPTKKLQPRFVHIPLELETDYAITLLASIISLTPGTVSSIVSSDKKTLVVHALHCPDEADAIAGMKRRYEAPLKEIFE
jgi:multicomponent K+:H+ antiporter subunit E